MQQHEIEVFCPSCDHQIKPQFGIHEAGRRTSLDFQSRRLGCYRMPVLWQCLHPQNLTG